MFVIAMEVISAEPHPSADALRVYQMKAPRRDFVQIIANLENIYQVGDLVAVALTNAVLKDGSKIKPTKLRGIYSYGMALGKVEAEVGQNLSDTYCQKNVIDTQTNLPIQKWASIELLHNVRRYLELVNNPTQIMYNAKIKLHGTNAGVQIAPDGNIAAQKRTQIINPNSDNAGFAAWVVNNLEYFQGLKSDRLITIYGEWCGSNIQKGVAIAKIGRKIFAVFAIQYGDEINNIRKLEVRPEKIRQFLPEHPDIFVLPFYGEPISFNFADVEQLQTASLTINRLVEQIETSDPWVKETFQIEGIGEGLVMYPETNGLVERSGYTELMFKAKGEKHQVVKTQQPVQIEPEVAKNIEEFVNLLVTEPRLEQAVAEACDGELNLEKMGVFLKWISTDINQESVAELEAAGLTWKQVNKSITNAAKKWYQEQVFSYKKES